MNTVQLQTLFGELIWSIRSPGGFWQTFNYGGLVPVQTNWTRLRASVNLN